MLNLLLASPSLDNDLGELVAETEERLTHLLPHLTPEQRIELACELLDLAEAAQRL